MPEANIPSTIYRNSVPCIPYCIIMCSLNNYCYTIFCIEYSSPSSSPHSRFCVVSIYDDYYTPPLGTVVHFLRRQSLRYHPSLHQTIFSNRNSHPTSICSGSTLPTYRWAFTLSKVVSDQNVASVHSHFADMVHEMA